MITIYNGAMSELVIPKSDLLTARLTERVSGWCCRSSVMAKFITGGKPVQWRATGTHADEVRGWITTEGNPASGRLPAGYKTLAAIGTNVEALRTQAEGLNGVPAVAYAIGKAVMATELPQETFAHQPVAEDDLVVVGLGQGRGDLVSTLGVYVPDSDSFVSADLPVSPLSPLEAGITPSEFAEWFPAGIRV